MSFSFSVLKISNSPPSLFLNGKICKGKNGALGNFEVQFSAGSLLGRLLKYSKEPGRGLCSQIFHKTEIFRDWSDFQLESVVKSLLLGPQTLHLTENISN